MPDIQKYRVMLIQQCFGLTLYPAEGLTYLPSPVLFALSSLEAHKINSGFKQYVPTPFTIYNETNIIEADKALSVWGQFLSGI